MFRTLLTNLRWGLLWGLGYAVAFSAFVGVMAILRGSTEYPQYGVTTWEVIVIYFAVGISGGLAIGLLRPLGRWRAGVALLGFVGGAIVYTGIGIALDGWSRDTLENGLILGMLVGPIAALVTNRQSESFDQRHN